VATYPTMEGTVDLGSPGVAPIPTLMAESIRFAHDRYNQDEGEIVINLPPKTPPHVYERVLREIGSGRVMRPEDTRAYHVETVRVRGLDGSVDLIYPRGDEFELVTIHFRKGLFSPYRVTDTRLWRIHVDVPPAHFYATPEAQVAPPEPPPADPPADAPEPAADGG
jgi:hypothetical protein